MDLVNMAKEMEAMAQTGLHFSKDPFDSERYSRLRELAAELLARSSNLSREEILEWSKAESRFFDIDRLPELSESRVLSSQIRDLYKAVQRNDTKTRYD